MRVRGLEVSNPESRNLTVYDAARDWILRYFCTDQVIRQLFANLRKHSEECDTLSLV